ncbi:MAG: S8 family serine peptidase [Bacteroidales bacterium]|nr:S8 family serine peptidase [Acholeplasmataceae bacterium]MCK9449852.1 S8 family serine peptidase [Bacteroidales bacterium]
MENNKEKQFNMKKLFTVLTSLFIVNFLFGQSAFYYYEGKKIPIDWSTDKIYVKFKDEKAESEKKQVIARISNIKTPEKRNLEHPNDVAILDILADRTMSGIKERIKDFNSDTSVVVANPFFISKTDSTLMGLTELFYVKLKSPSDFTELERLAKETNTFLLKQNEFEPSVYILVADKNSNGNALEMANYFYETNIFEYAAPSFMRILKKQCTNDPFFNQQWGLKNTGQHSGISGADINVCQAWEITRGRDVISVAVLDEGVDLNHPDLIHNLLPGFDATGQGSSGAPQGDDAHGTACAGIIAAQGNNNEGISGVAPNCRIIPIRIAYGDGFGGWITEDIWIANGINWAWQNGADILSNSWGGGDESSLITNAINNAVSNGRDGLGCPVLFASGNNNGSVSYPARLSSVIAVGAMSMCNERKTPSSCDGETNWGSNFGGELDIIAPGVKIYTTDITGSAGYDGGNYTSTFNGTSSACPHAAGVMALILSVNRCLTQTEARRILELSCNKVGTYCYNSTSGRPNGTWNNQMGYGRINAYNSVRYAFSTQINSYTNVSGTDQGANNCSGNLCTWQLISGGCSGLAAANYFVYWHRVEANVTYPFTSGATVIGTSNGFSFSSPNNGNYFMGASNVTSTSATLYTYVFETYNVLGQFLGWVPTAPQNIRFNYHVLSILDQDIYLQNQTVSTGTYTHNAMNKIEAGYDVTTAVPYGNYVVEGDANVTLHAGNSITLGPGTSITPGANGSFHAYIEPFFTCTQYPMGMILNDDNNNGFPAVINDYRVTMLKEEDFFATDSKPIETVFKIYPNPSNGDATIEYTLDNSEFVEITIHDNCGRPIYKLKNKSLHKAGKYQIKLTGVNLAAGIYYCILQTESEFKTNELIIVR